MAEATAVTPTQAKAKRPPRVPMKQLVARPMAWLMKHHLPPQTDPSKLVTALQYMLLAYFDFQAGQQLSTAMAAMSTEELYSQCVFMYAQSTEKLLKGLLMLLKPTTDLIYVHDLSWLSLQLERLNLKLFRRPCSQLEKLGWCRPDARSLSVRCRFPYFPPTETPVGGGVKLPVQLFGRIHSDLARKYCLQVVKIVFCILSHVFDQRPAWTTLSTQDATVRFQPDTQHLLFELRGNSPQAYTVHFC